MVTDKRKFYVTAPEMSKEMIAGIPTMRDGDHLELFYNLIFNDMGISLPDHLRPIVWALGDKNITNLMVIISPGSGKSFLSGIAYPLWELGLNQNITILGVSGGADLMMKWLQSAMDIMEHNRIYKLLFPNVKPDKDMGWSRTTAFIKRDISGEPNPSYEALGYACYSDDTEVLTKRGWLLFKDTNKEDWFATRNMKTREFEWERAIELFEYDYTGIMKHFKGISLNMLVTPNHNILVNSLHSTSKDRLISASDAESYKYGSIKIPSYSEWNGIEIIEKKFGNTDERVVTANKRKENIIDGHGKGISLRKLDKLFNLTSSSINKIIKGKATYSNPQPWGKDIIMTGDDYCAFMGMWLSEGHVNNNQVRITQFRESKGFYLYKLLLNKIFGQEVYYNDDCHQFIITSTVLSTHLKQYGHSKDKYIPQDILNASKEQLLLFWNYYVLGDGWITKAAGQEGISTVSLSIANQMQEVLQKLGKVSSMSTELSVEREFSGRILKGGTIYYRVSILKSKYRSFKITDKYYSGKVYCVSVPNSTLYVRRKGKTTWSGNSKKIVGAHAKLLVIDDIHDDENSQNSDQIEKVEEFYYRTLLGRKDPQGSRMVMIGRRWAADDLYGRLKDGGSWLTMTLANFRDSQELYFDMRIPAGLACIFNDFQANPEVEDIYVVYAENTVMPGFFWTGKADDPLVKTKYDEVMQVRKNKPYIFETVYQSNPESSSNKIFDKADFRDFVIPDGMYMGRNYNDVANFIRDLDFDMLIQSWDTAVTAESINDPSVGYTIGLKGCVRNHRSEDSGEIPYHYDLYILDEIYKRLQIGDLKVEVKDYYDIWRPNYVLVENSTAGIPIIQSLESDGIQVIPVIVQHTSKRSRAVNGAKAGSAQGWAKQGNILIPRMIVTGIEVPWATDLLNELDGFTGAKGKRDDRVDAVVQAANFAIELGIRNRDLPEGWRTDAEIDDRLLKWQKPNNIFEQYSALTRNVANPLYGLCGTCKFFKGSFCNYHKKAVTLFSSCPVYQATSEATAVMDVEHGQRKR